MFWEIKREEKLREESRHLHSQETVGGLKDEQSADQVAQYCRGWLMKAVKGLSSRVLVLVLYTNNFRQIFQNLVYLLKN